MTQRPLREPLEEMVEELARRRSEPPPRMFHAGASVVREALEQRVGLQVEDDQIEDVLVAGEGRASSGEWTVERVGPGDFRFRRRED